MKLCPSCRPRHNGRGWFSLLPLLLLLIVVPANAKPPARYRDFKAYTTSRPDPADAARIAATMQLRNEGKAPLKIAAVLQPDAAAGFAGGKFAATVAAGQQATWQFELRPPAGFKRAILSGTVSFDGVVDRELLVSVQGADAEDFKDVNITRITARAEVSATYVPRTHDSVLRLMNGKPRRASITLAANGNTRYSIVAEPLAGVAAGGDALASWRADKSLAPAAQELVDAIDDLQRCVRLQSGATLALAGGAVAATPSIRLKLLPSSATSATVALGDAYTIKTTRRGDIVITASALDGLRHGVYGLLTDYLDCHWFQPRQLGEEIIVPADRTVRLPQIDERRAPSWFSTTGMSWGNAPRWDRQNRALVNRGRMSFGHSWQGYINSAEFPYEKFPDMWARDREGKIRKKDEGWTFTNFCSTSPEVIEIVARKINAQLTANPEAIVASIDPNDYAPMCLCDRCLALDKQYGVTQLDGTEVADRLLHFSRQIHERLEPRFKDKFLGFLMYGFQMELPKGATAHERQAGMLCNFPPRYDHSRPWNDPTSEKNVDFYRLVKGWGAILKQTGYYDYYGHYYFFGPYAMVHKMREDLPAFRDLGGTFLMIEAQPNFAMQGLNHYIAARLAWDVDADVDVLMEEFFTKYYGPAAGPMRDFWLTAEKFYALERPGTRTEMRVGAHPEFWTELEGHLARAEAAVAKLGADGHRYKDRIAFHRDGFDYGVQRNEFLTRYWPRRGAVRDVEGAIRHIETHRGKVAELRRKYAATDPYWPTMLADYFYPDYDEQLAALRKRQNP